MSNPNPVNLNNLDGRYSKPADVSAAIAASSPVGKAVKTYRSGATNGGGSTVVQVPLDSAAFNDDTNYYSLGSGVLTVKKAGLYMITFWADITCTSAFAIFVRVNGTTVQESGSSSGTRVSATLVTRLSVNDTVGLFMYGNSSSITANGTTNSKDVGLGAAFMGT